MVKEPEKRDGILQIKFLYFHTQTSKALPKIGPICSATTSTTPVLWKEYLPL